MNLIDELIETLELMLNPNSADLGIKLFLERDFDDRIKKNGRIAIDKNWRIDSSVIFIRWFNFGKETFYVFIYSTRESSGIKG